MKDEALTRNIVQQIKSDNDKRYKVYEERMTFLDGLEERTNKSTRRLWIFHLIYLILLTVITMKVW